MCSSDLRAHARRRLKCRIRDRGRLRFRARVPVRGRVRVWVRSQDVPGAEPTAGQCSPRKAELRAHGTVPVRIRLWLPRPQTSIGPWSRRPPESFRTAAPRPRKRHGELPGSMPSQLAPLLDPRPVVLSDVGIGAPWGLSLSSVRVRSTDVACAEATPVL